MNPIKLKKIYEAHSDATDFVRSVWRRYTGRGCGYFQFWEHNGKHITVHAEGPQRTGSREYQIDIPIEEFTCDKQSHS